MFPFAGPLAEKILSASQHERIIMHIPSKTSIQLVEVIWKYKKQKLDLNHHLWLSFIKDFYSVLKKNL